MKTLTSVLIPLLTVSLSSSAFAVSEEELSSVKEAIKELCETPTKKGERFRIEGKGEGGVLIKFLKVGLEGNVEKSIWEGIEQFPETQAERLDCVVTLAGIFSPYSPNLKETNDKVEEHEKIVEIPCNVHKENVCITFGASSCSALRDIDKKFIDTCRWDHIQSEITCNKTYGLWETPEGRYAIRHPGTVKPGDKGSCTTSEYNLRNEKYLKERRAVINR